MQNTSHVEVLLHPNERLLAVRKIEAMNKNAVPWRTGQMSSKKMSRVLYELMGWQKDWRYKIAANFLSNNKDQVIIFDLNCCEFHFKNKKNGSRAARIIPSEWLVGFGEEMSEYMMLCRRALAQHLSDWYVDALPSTVKGFESGFTLPSSKEIEQRIAKLKCEMRSRNDK